MGQKVCALVAGGGYAEYCIARADVCWPVPPSLSMEEAAAIPETLMTVWHNVFERGYACDGETMLVHGGTSGIGTMAIKLGKLFGLEVIVTCRLGEKCAAALAIGAATMRSTTRPAISSRRSAPHRRQGRASGARYGRWSYVPRNLKCLSEDGRHVTIAVQGGLVAEINMAQVMSRRLTLTGSTLRPRSNEFKTLLAEEIGRTVWPLVESGELRPTMAQSFALTDAAAAHAHMESGDHVGKIVLTI
jgi:NADPH2:quinone reductase